MQFWTAASGTPVPRLIRKKSGVLAESHCPPILVWLPLKRTGPQLSDAMLCLAINSRLLPASITKQNGTLGRGNVAILIFHFCFLPVVQVALHICYYQDQPVVSSE